MTWTIAFVVGLATGWILRALRRAAKPPFEEKQAAPVASHAPIAPAAPIAVPVATVATPAPADPPAPRTLHAIATALEPPYESSSHPRDLLDNTDFQDGVRRLASAEFTLDQTATYCCGANRELAVMAGEALALRIDSGAALNRVLDHIGRGYVWTTFYELRYLQARADRPVVGTVLARTPEWWAENAVLPQILSDFIDARIKGGEAIDLGAALASKAGADLAPLDAMLGKLTTQHAPLLREQVAAWRRTRLDRAYLASVGRLRGAEGSDRNEPAVIPAGVLPSGVTVGLEAILKSPPRSFVIVGEAGVGKTALLRLIEARLAKHGWTVFEGSAIDINAGMSYIGELEGRMRRLLDELDVRRKVVWYVPNIHELFYAGRHKLSPMGILDLIMPAVEAGRICVIGEAQPAALERVLQQRPRLRGAFASLAIEPMAPADAATLGEQLLAREAASAGIAIEPGIVAEALELARHYLGARALPGSLVELLRLTRDRLVKTGNGATFDRDALLATLTDLTGLPRSVLDDRSGLEATALRGHFAARVMGQPEAVDALVDRVAMLKAGFTDPGRPIGVFLFAGPTGTGKTEVAKTLAEFLFGHADRMIRLDMSEFQEPAALIRIIGEPGENAEANALVNRIRKQPFSVVLLDEFEKAHPRVWDLFLQVFDDGRLTDAQGTLADFRHAIIILTSNLGATVHQGSSLGFTDNASPFNAAQVTRTIHQTFRPEFVNRLDRVVVFRPLARAVMRDILKKELQNVLLRRGFRTRDWAVEWEESAIEFLLDRGFTPDMGARPLRRAIEQYVLAPIAMTIVERRHPEGDQFLFVRSDGAGIQVEFVDPDAEDDLSGVESKPATPFHVEQDALTQHIASAAWCERKDAAYARMNTPGFWDEADRFAVLDRIERIDRIEAGVAASQSLLQRLDGRASPASVAASLREQVHLLRAAIDDLDGDVPGDAYLTVEAIADDATPAEASAWAARLIAMYTQWAKKRRMRSAVLADRNGSAVLAVSGFGAHRLLQREAGLHVFEVGDDDRASARYTARVHVAPQPVIPKPAQQSELDRARAMLAAHPLSNSIVRRYRERPAPLVRDVVSGWRSGKFAQVLAGDFDRGDWR